MNPIPNAVVGGCPSPTAFPLVYEVWKDIPGFEGRYQASTFGRIKSLSRQVRGANHYTGNEFLRTVPECILRPGQYCKAGHVSVVLRRGSTGIAVHQLVMLTFVGERPKGMEVLHNNGDPTDNRLENLRYDTRTENILDVYRQGGRWRKLNTENVEAIRFALYCGILGSDLAREYGVSQQNISNIKNRRIFWWLD